MRSVLAGVNELDIVILVRSGSTIPTKAFRCGRLNCATSCRRSREPPRKERLLSVIH